jgi:hypothetical protein
LVIKDQVFAPINLALNIITFGVSGGASSAATAGANTALGGASAASAGATKLALGSHWITLFQALEKANTVVETVTGTQDKVDYVLANVDNLETELTRWNYEYERHFWSLTSERIDRMINERLPHPEDAAYIKQKFGQYQLVTMLEADGWRIANTVLTAASFEPSGIVAVIQAFAQPLCRTDINPFPTVSIIPRDQRGPRDKSTFSGPVCN